jgi:hypothetical protein
MRTYGVVLVAIALVAVAVSVVVGSPTSVAHGQVVTPEPTTSREAPTDRCCVPIRRTAPPSVVESVSQASTFPAWHPENLLVALALGSLVPMLTWIALPWALRRLARWAWA